MTLKYFSQKVVCMMVCVRACAWVCVNDINGMFNCIDALEKRLVLLVRACVNVWVSFLTSHASFAIVMALSLKRGRYAFYNQH